MTLALSAGVPLEIVQKVTGHRTAGIVMKHYFQPGREDFRRTLAGKMPALLVGSGPKLEPPSTKELLAKLEEMTMETWATVRNELVARLGGAVPNRGGCPGGDHGLMDDTPSPAERSPKISPSVGCRPVLSGRHKRSTREK